MPYPIANDPKPPPKRRQWQDIGDGSLLTEMEGIAARILGMLGQAQREILLENYIFEAGRWPERVLEILVAKARDGVDVHLTLDAVGSLYFPRQWEERLRAAGAQLRWFHRLRLGGLERVVRRTHRRILVVDGERAALGGFAISDDWLTGGWTGRPYREIFYAFSGPLVAVMREVFAQHHPLPHWGGGLADDPRGWWGKGRAIANDPPYRRQIRNRLLAMFRGARESIWVATPYFDPDFRMRQALRRAARRGVDVRLLLPGPFTDHPLLRFGAQRYYHSLLRVGIRIFEYEPAFLHGKYALVDGRWVTIGSANLDLISHWFNRELNLEARGPLPVLLLRTLFVREFGRSREITPEVWERRPLWRRFVEGVLGAADRWVQRRALRRQKP